MTATASPESAPSHDTPNPNSPTATTDKSRLPLVTDVLSIPLSGTSSLQERPETPTETQSTPPNPWSDSYDANRSMDTSIRDGDADGRPTKRRRVRDITPHNAPRRPKPESPPWKKIEPDGPTTFHENGKRRSGRTNAVPLELQPQGHKRMTRGALHSLQPPSPPKDKRIVANSHVNGTQRQASAGKGTPSKAPIPSAKLNTRKSLGSNSRPSLRTRRQSPTPLAQTTPPRRSARTQRSSRATQDGLDVSPLEPTQPADENPDLRPTKIRLRLRAPAIPTVHPAQANVFPGQSIARPKIASDFRHFVRRAPSVDVKDGGWFDLADEGDPYTEEAAQKDAVTIMRIAAEAEPGGLLSEGRSTLYAPEPAEEPPRQWAHRDHLVKQMAYFRKLMLIEQQRHRVTAKRLAEACRDEWIRRQPKTAEQIETEARAAWASRYKTVVKAMGGIWDNVKTEINRRRLEEWEAAEQKRVKAALNEAVNMSELKLQARRAHFDSEPMSDEDDGGAARLDEEVDEEEDDLASDGESNLGGETDKDEDEDNMSSSGDEDDLRSTISDEGLTQDQLREKYANIPDLPVEDSNAGTVSDHDQKMMLVGDQDETSDESIDMDDDLGSSDEETGTVEDGGTSDIEEASADDEEPSELLSLFFGKSELQEMRREAVASRPHVPQQDAPMEDAPGTAPSQEAICADKSNRSGSSRCTDASDEAFYREKPLSLLRKRQISPENASIAQLDQDKTSGDVPETFFAMAAGPSKSPREANNPGAPFMIPEPRQAQVVETDAIDVVERDKGNVRENAPTEAVEQTVSKRSGVDVTAALSDQQPLATPDTDAISNPPSRYRSQSPRTSDTKPSEIDTASVIKSGGSRSTSPQYQAPRTDVPFLLRGTLREYQHDGLDWLAGLYSNQTNGILADEMGLGKTIQTIALLAHLACHHEVWGPHLVIVPTSVMLNWEMEFKKWCPGFKVLSYYGSIDERKRKRQGWKTDDIWNVCITSYQIVLQDQQVFKRRQWHYMILDEAHNIKNFKSKRWQTLLTFNTQARLLLTGTPLQNNLTELWSLLFFLMPSENGVGGFADLTEFQDWFHKPESQILESGREQMDDEARAIIAKLHKVLRPYLLRRLKAEVEKQMPAKYEHVEFCRLSRRQRELYDGFLARTDTREALSSGNYISVINCLMQLRKVCNHPDLFVERPIMTSFRQRRSVLADYEATENLVRERLLAEKPMRTVNMSFLNLVPTQHEDLSKTICERISQLSSHRALVDLREAQRARAQAACADHDPTTIESNLARLENVSRWGRFEELQHCVYLNALRRQQRPVYGKQLRDLLTLGIDERPCKPRPRIPQKIMGWLEEESPVLRSMVLTLDQRAASMRTTISKFACVTPAVVTRDLDRFVLGSKGVEVFNDVNLRLVAPVRRGPFVQEEARPDPWHEARMRLSIQFPDKRLLQYDCGKLQALDRLLRKLQSGGHRALIFTQMTKVLDILEQFLNIHGHKYLRLDGATKVEQRQILTDRFNHDSRILCFILSTRSGGLGINLTGADTVIFYDQDWNPAMDKQCQDRCHRIGQTRDVHIYRLVSEHTIEANILRKASQKQMLDDIVIQEGGFTTDYFNKLSVRDVIGSTPDESDVVGDAMDRVLGGVESSDQRTVGRVLEQAEDREDVDAAHIAEREIQEDEADFAEKPATASASGASSARQGTPATRDGSMALGAESYPRPASADGAPGEAESNAWGEEMHTIDDYMLAAMGRQLEGTALELPRDKKKKSRSKKGKDTRKR
ncbi:SNF2 family domain-containing protein [Durotheca rogersii]|uniref:SNF2 family domain-containing protein n=1 Tax=Durotheca rogersii TaxID=419775 RepID=UPI00221F52ED|nr:SNF2 family domain-containing protein [Durotheca rogersii]KAI5853284.1 SNF2 family domain-containing protein [Durotheca rogersii]